ncbi:MAG: Gx transporter family protein [Magnetococcales bacterium]|nr:Gx transporter family protein [Magnetococcales bacterium]
MKTDIRPDLLIAYFAAAAVAAHVLEAAIPGPGPWFKMGLANIFTLVAFFHLGWGAAAIVSIIRVVAGSLALGTFLSPTFFLSFSGATGAVALMGVVALSPFRLGPVGVSILASLAHMVSQVVMAWVLIIGHDGIFLALPWFLIGSWFTGLVNGLLAFLILKRVAQHQTMEIVWR